MSLDIVTAIRRCARHGMVTREELLRAGVARSAIDRAVRSGLLIKAHQGIYLVAGAPDLWLARALADVCYVDRQGRRLQHEGDPGPVVALTGTGAGALLQLPHVDRPTTPVVVSSHLSRVRGVATLHRESLRRAEVRLLHGVPSTDVAWTIGELAHVLTHAHLLNVVADAIREEMTTIQALLAVADRMGEAGEPLRTFLLRLRPGDLEARASTERRLLRGCVRRGIDPPLLNHVLNTPWRPIELDAAWLRRRANLEIDGPHHQFRQQELSDGRRDTMPDTLGWVHDRVTADEVRDDLDGVLDLVEDLLARADARDLADGIEPDRTARSGVEYDA